MRLIDASGGLPLPAYSTIFLEGSNGSDNQVEGHKPHNLAARHHEAELFRFLLDRLEYDIERRRLVIEEVYGHTWARGRLRCTSRSRAPP